MQIQVNKRKKNGMRSIGLPSKRIKNVKPSKWRQEYKYLSHNTVTVDLRTLKKGAVNFLKANIS